MCGSPTEMRTGVDGQKAIFAHAASTPREVDAGSIRFGGRAELDRSRSISRMAFKDFGLALAEAERTGDADAVGECRA
jgi:hypothetical protein